MVLRYDTAGNRLTVSDPDLGNWSYIYDKANRLISQTDARGVTTAMTYDQMGRPLTRTVPATGEVLMNNTYDEARSIGLPNVGHLTTSTNPDATHVIDWHVSGSEKERVSTVFGETVTTTTGLERNMPIHTCYATTISSATDCVGSNTERWVYTTAGDLQSIPGYITGITYGEAEQQMIQ